MVIFRPFIFIVSLFAISVVYGGSIYINENNALQIEGQDSWRINDFKILGYQVTIDFEVYLSEGVLSNSKDNFDVSITKNNNVVIYFEVIENKLWRGSLLSSSIPIQVKNSDEVLYLDLTLATAIKNYGKYEALSGEDIGSYLTFENLNDASFHTMCSFFKLEQSLEEQEMSEDQFNDYCTLDRMLFFGNRDVFVSNEI